MTALLALAMIAAEPTLYQKHHCEEPQSQTDMNVCAGLDFQKADAELNAMWRDVVARARAADRGVDRKRDKRPSSEKRLLRAQKAWLQFRDAHCDYEGYEARGGSMEPMIISGCRARLTRERIDQLTAETH